MLIHVIIEIAQKYMLSQPCVLSEITRRLFHLVDNLKNIWPFIDFSELILSSIIINLSNRRQCRENPSKRRRNT